MILVELAMKKVQFIALSNAYSQATDYNYVKEMPIHRAEFM